VSRFPAGGEGVRLGRSLALQFFVTLSVSEGARVCVTLNAVKDLKNEMLRCRSA